MSYTFSPWRALLPMLRDARKLRREGRRRMAMELLEEVAANRRRYLTSGTFRPPYVPQPKREP